MPRSCSVCSATSRPVRLRIGWSWLTSESGALEFETVAFDHALYVLYRSGTTSKPKAIVHRHSGILLERLQLLGLDHELGASDRFFWLTTTEWMMWHCLVSGLAVRSTIALFDGTPAHPDLLQMWRYAEEVGITVFAVGALFYVGCDKGGVTRSQLDLNRVREIASTGTPRPPSGFE